MYTFYYRGGMLTTCTYCMYYVHNYNTHTVLCKYNIHRVRHTTCAYIVGLQILQVPSTTIQCIHKHASTDTNTWKHFTVCVVVKNAGICLMLSLECSYKWPIIK